MDCPMVAGHAQQGRVSTEVYAATVSGKNAHQDSHKAAALGKRNLGTAANTHTHNTHIHAHTLTQSYTHTHMHEHTHTLSHMV